MFITTPQLKISLNIHSFIHHMSDAITVNKNVLRVSLNKTFPSSFLPWAVQHFRQLYINEICVYQWVMLIVMCGTFSKAVKQCHTFILFFFLPLNPSIPLYPVKHKLLWLFVCLLLLFF